MKVKLISKTHNPVMLMYTTCKTCTSNNTPQKIFEDTNSDIILEMINLVKSVLKKGHLSIAEHINFTFAIEGISRACSHQLVRHRHCTFSQQSQRYVKLNHNNTFNFVVPPSILKNEDTLARYKTLMGDLEQFYLDVTIEDSIPAEDARMVLPNACATNLVMTCNLRELMHICNLRLCKRAQWEIRELVEEMKKQVVEWQPWLEEFLVPNCKNCTEEKCFKTDRKEKF